MANISHQRRQDVNRLKKDSKAIAQKRLKSLSKVAQKQLKSSSKAAQK